MKKEKKTNKFCYSILCKKKLFPLNSTLPFIISVKLWLKFILNPKKFHFTNINPKKEQKIEPF